MLIAREYGCEDVLYAESTCPRLNRKPHEGQHDTLNESDVMTVHSPNESAHDRKADMPFCTDVPGYCVNQKIEELRSKSMLTHPFRTATAAIMILPRMMAMIACHTASPAETSEAPNWKLLSVI